MRPINEIIVHCTATPAGREVSVDTIRSWHKQRGWRDIGYHWVVHLDGSVEEGRPVGQVGAHVAGHNTGTIGVVYVGGVDKDMRAKDTRTAAQKDGLEKLLRDLMSHYPSVTKISGHNQYAAKACPCFDARQEYAQLLSEVAAPPTVINSDVPVSGKGTVTASTLNLRSEPKMSGRDIGDIPRGTTVDIFGSDGDWLKIKTPAGYEGWVARRYVAVAGSDPIADPSAHFETTAPVYMRRLIDDIPQWSALDAAAAFGNFGHESAGLEILEEISGGGGYGWPQWTGSRRRAYETWCRENGLDPASDEANYRYVVIELRGPEERTIAAVAKANGLEAKTLAFERSFERAGVKHDDRRLDWATRALAAYRAAYPKQEIDMSAAPAEEEKTGGPVEKMIGAGKGAAQGAVGGVTIGGGIVIIGTTMGWLPPEADTAMFGAAVTGVLTGFSSFVMACIGAYRAPANGGS
ncbi:phage tail tip lysozyme [Jiella marina]|uniref:phage tail tip lysozyme n=1 Tax=Jiella sp. LLJ827 TaxID=2917712 RepID=UPI0021009E69|nr:phage tail tip lysozyme [Jiella sp. LLJ827]MCQ0987558.1 phage tail tip lysozyme [Jiella sp. LLJ827]